MLEIRTGQAIPCPGCGTEVAAHFLICPACHRLVHADRLRQLAEEAGEAEAGGDLTGAMVAWRSALELLPPQSRQAETITAKVGELGKQMDAAPGRKKSMFGDGSSNGAGWASPVGILVLVLSKGKLLLLGLTKLSTLTSMFAMVGTYWALWGWPFAVGLVLSIYIHEMGHVAALRRYGIKADAPMFIPGIGAIIRARQKLATPREEAQVGLAGPLWGTAGAALTFIAAYGLHMPILDGIARIATFINLFNLIPILMLDGDHAYRAFSRNQRWLACLVISSLWATMDGTNERSVFVILLLMIVSVWRAGFSAGSKEPDRLSFLEYLGLVVALTLMLRIPELPL